MSFTSLIKDAKCDNLLYILNNDTIIYAIFEISTGIWQIGVTDGIDVWRILVDNADLKLHIAQALTSQDAFFAKFRDSFATGELTTVKKGASITLKIGTGSGSLEFSLDKLNDTTPELQKLIFSLAKRSMDSEQRLHRAEQALSSMKRENALVDLGTGRKTRGKQAKVHAPEKGMSTINPGSRKRKEPSGVQFS